MPNPQKDFAGWSVRIQELEAQKRHITFAEGEVWRAALGVSLGREVLGRGPNYQRPVVILVKHHSSLCMVVPLTTHHKPSKHHIGLTVKGIARRALLDQIRTIDCKRLIQRIDTLSPEDFSNLKQAVIALLLKE